MSSRRYWNNQGGSELYETTGEALPFPVSYSKGQANS
jgi:hypothetical protein